jgi:hypothetical protein
MWWTIEPKNGGSVLRRSFRARGRFSDELAERYRKGARTAIEVSLKSYLERVASSGPR